MALHITGRACKFKKNKINKIAWRFWSNITHTCSLGRGTLGRSLCKTSRHSAWDTASAVSFSCKAVRGVKKTEERRDKWVRTIQSPRRPGRWSLKHMHPPLFRLPLHNLTKPSSGIKTPINVAGAIYLTSRTYFQLPWANNRPHLHQMSATLDSDYLTCFTSPATTNASTCVLEFVRSTLKLSNKFQNAAINLPIIG